MTSADLAKAASRIALRLDDVGASSKKYEVYSNHIFRLGRLKLSANWLILKYLPQFKAWGPYRELRAREWEWILFALDQYNAKLTVGVTATWVEDSDLLIPFPDRFPDEALMLKEGMKAGLLEIANHGLTHCVLENNAFKPALFSSNRKYHREFWDWIPEENHFEHIRRSQEILQEFFQTEVVTFIPPGNVFSEITLLAASQNGLRYLSGNTAPRLQENITIIGQKDTVTFHDRDLVLGGIKWLENILAKHKEKTFVFVRELAERESAPSNGRNN